MAMITNLTLNQFINHMFVKEPIEMILVHLKLLVMNNCILIVDCLLSCRHQYDPMAGPGHELELGDTTADWDMKKMVIDYRSRQIQ